MLSTFLQLKFEGKDRVSGEQRAKCDLAYPNE